MTMTSKNAFQKKYVRIERSSQQLPPKEELINFLNFYLEPDQASRIEKMANFFVLNPRVDTKDFVSDVFHTIKERLRLDRGGLKEIAQKLINDYKAQMKTTQDCESVCSLYGQGTSSSHSCNQERTDAARELIEGLSSIIPEARRSNLRSLACHTKLEDLDDFLNGLQEDLDDFMVEMEHEVIRRLQARLDDFLNLLQDLRKQLILVDKINLVIDALTEENVPEEEKKEIASFAEQIIDSLKTSKLTPDVEENITKLINNAISVSESVSTARFNNVVKELRMAANFICEHEELSSLVELIRFLTLYLNYETVKSIEKRAKKQTLQPDGDTKGLVNFVRGEINKKLKRDREEVKEVTEELISDYRNQMQNSEKQNLSRDSFSIASFDSERLDAGKKLVEALEGMIPEPKRSNFEHTTLQVTKECLDDYVNELRKELDDYVDDREREIKHRLNVTLENFENDLFTLSRQLRVVSKIDSLVEILKKENIPEEAKATIYNIAEPVINTLKKSKHAPVTAKIISELTRRANGLAEMKTSKNFKKAVKNLEEAVNYLFGEYKL